MDLFEFFEMYNETAVAFSGGVDSSYLLHAALEHGALVKAYYVMSPFQPAFELEDAKRITDQLQVEMEVLTLDTLSVPCVSSNPKDRCYHCKKYMFQQIIKAAARDGFSVVLDGTNASDQVSDRPGMRAISELGVESPLRDAGLTKEDVRRLSKEAGLFTWEKPAYACLATRIPTGTTITLDLLQKVELAESYLKTMFNLTDFRVRLLPDSTDKIFTAKIQVPTSQMHLVLEHKHEITAELKKYFNSVVLDLEGRNEQ